MDEVVTSLKYWGKDPKNQTYIMNPNRPHNNRPNKQIGPKTAKTNKVGDNAEVRGVEPGQLIEMSRRGVTSLTSLLGRLILARFDASRCAAGLRLDMF